AIKSLEEAIVDIPASRRNLVRRFKQATGMTPIRYLQRTKIEAAKKLLENTEKGMLEIMLSAGYNDMKNFRQLFKDNTSMTPKAYRYKFAMRFEAVTKSNRPASKTLQEMTRIVICIILGYFLMPWANAQIKPGEEKIVVNLPSEYRWKGTKIPKD